MAYYNQNELKKIGFKKIGNDVMISNKCSIYNPKNIIIGDNVRIDDFCILSSGHGGIEIGNNVHIACYVSIIGKEKITLSDFSGISSKVSIYSSNDDYSGEYLTGPTIPNEYTNVTSKPVFLGKHVVIGSGSVILPGVTLSTGVAVGSMSLVNKSFDDFMIVGGIPAKFLKDRKKELINLELTYYKNKTE